MTDQPITYVSPQVSVSTELRLLETSTTNGVKCDWSGQAEYNAHRDQTSLKLSWTFDWKALESDGAGDVSGYITVTAPGGCFPAKKVEVDLTESIQTVTTTIKNVSTQPPFDVAFAFSLFEDTLINESNFEAANPTIQHGLEMIQIYERKLRESNQQDHNIANLNVSHSKNGISGLENASNLMSLHMQSCDIEDFQQLPTLKRLHFLDVSNNRLSGSALTSLRLKTPKLATLLVHNNMLKSSDLEPLKSLNWLRELSTTGNNQGGLNDKDYRQLVLQLLPKLQLLDGIENENVVIGDDHVDSSESSISSISEAEIDNDEVALVEQ